jgi:lipopolysaccharide export system protein LptA
LKIELPFEAKSRATLGTTTFAQQETRRKKWMLGLVLGALLATTASVTLTYIWNRVRQQKPVPIPEALPSNVHEDASGYSFTRSIEGRQIFTVHAARAVAFKERGATVLQDVIVEIFGRAGNRHDVLRTHEGEYNPQTGDFSSSGKVEIQLNAPKSAIYGPNCLAQPPVSRGGSLTCLETSEVSFNQRGSMAVTNAPVQFRVGTATGSARGMKYATQDGWLELDKDVVIELPARAASASTAQVPIHLSASHLRYDSPRGATGIVKLDGPLEIVQGTRRALAQSGTVSLDNRNRVTQAALDDVKALDSSETNAMNGRAKRVRGEFDPASGRLRTLVTEGDVKGEIHRNAHQRTYSQFQAQQAELAFEGAPPQPTAGIGSGDVRLTIESPAVAVPNSPSMTASDHVLGEKKTLSASQVRFFFRPGGKSLREMETVGSGQLILVSADPNVGPREITAGQLLMAFDTRSQIQSLRGISETRIVFQPGKTAPPGTTPQETWSDLLESIFDPATQALAQVEQIGNFRFKDGDRRANAARAKYFSATQALALIGHPELSDPDTRVVAEHIWFDLRTGTEVGEGKVQSTQFGEKTAAGVAASEPTHVLADRMQAQRRSQFVHYDGHVRAWHGTDVVESSELDVWRSERRFTSGLGVLSSHFKLATLMPGAPPSKRQNEPRPAIVRADRLDYLEAGRKASYHGHVQLQTENTVLKGDRMDVYFSNSKSGDVSEIERAVADGHVTVIQPTRHAAGEHGEYEAAPGKIQLTGGSPTLYDAEKGTTTGQRLTFFVHDDRLIVDGSDQLPTSSKHRVTQ